MSTQDNVAERLPVPMLDMHRAIVSLREELQAIDDYNQRAELCDDAELKAVIRHNRKEEKEHAAMLVEWIRRHDPEFSTKLKGILFSEGTTVRD